MTRAMGSPFNMGPAMRVVANIVGLGVIIRETIPAETEPRYALLVVALVLLGLINADSLHKFFPGYRPPDEPPQPPPPDPSVREDQQQGGAESET